MNFSYRPAAKTVSPTNHRFISRNGTRFSDAGRTMLCGLLLGAWLPAFANPVTFQVNLGVQRVLGNFNPQNGDTAVVSGNFSAPDWTTTSTLSPLAENPDVYAGTFPSDIAGGDTIQYKFIINPGGNSPANQLVWESGSNRSVPATGTDQTLPVVYFNNVTDANFIVVTQVTFQVNLAAQIESGSFNPATDFVTVAGDAVNNWNATASMLTNQPLAPHLWRGTLIVTNQVGTPVQYKFLTHRGPGDFTWEEDGVGPAGAQNRSYLTVNRTLTLPLVDFNNESAPVEFIAGADMSHLIFFEDRGITYRANGQVRDALEILRERGINLVRLRLFNSTDTQGQNNPYNYINNLNYNLPLAVRVKNAGMKFLLDFHYSDTWADPGKQAKPAAWTNLTFAELRTEIRTFSSNAVAAFAAVGAMPDYVQIGNEIIGGMLWDDGRVGGSFENNTQWSQFSQLLTNAIQGVKDASGAQMPTIIIHIDRGGDWNATRWFFDNLTARQVPFDMIGQSYYPWWHGSPQALQNCLSNAAVRYGKPQIIMEAAFPRSNSTNIFGIPASTNGQVQFVAELAKIVKNIPGGIGIVWWGSEYQQLAGFNLAGFHQRSLFGAGGEVLPAAAALGALTAPIKLAPQWNGAALQLEWPLSGAGHSLVSNTNLQQPTWTNVTNAVQSTGSVFQTTVEMETEGARFFRLQSN